MPDRIGEPSPLRTFGFSSLRRRWRLIGICAALSLIAGLLFIVFKPESYTSATQLLVYVRELQPGPEPVISPGRADLAQVQNEIEIIRSRGMLAKVAQSLNLAGDNEFVPRQTRLRSLTDWALRPPRAVVEENRAELDRAVLSLEKRVKVQRVGTSHTILVSVTTSDPHKSERIANAIGQVALQARVSAELEGSRSPLLRERLQGLGPNAYVMTTAGAAGRPDGPRKVVVIPAAALFGIALGSALALLLDFVNRTVRTAAQVEYLGMECIGAIPQLRRVSGEGELPPNAMLDQTLRRATVAVESAKARIIGVTSAVAGEGATTVAQRLAQLAVRSGKKVLLADASLVSKAESSQDIDGGAAWWTRYDQSRLGTYDFVVVDLPPLERGPEFRMAAQNLDGILLVLKWGSTELEKVERAIALAGVGPSEFIGAVLNRVDERMIGKFGDKLWEAESALVARRRPLGFSMPAEQAIG